MVHDGPSGTTNIENFYANGAPDGENVHHRSDVQLPIEWEILSSFWTTETLAKRSAESIGADAGSAVIGDEQSLGSMPVGLGCE